MEWREEVRTAVREGVFLDNGTIEVDMPGLMAALKDMPNEIKAALARELLAGTGMLIGPWLPALEHMKALDVSGIGRIDGVRAYRYLLSQADPDACRAAMMGEK